MKDFDTVKEKSKTIKTMSENNEVKSLCDVIILLVNKIEELNKENAGFKS